MVLVCPGAAAYETVIFLVRLLTLACIRFILE
jgi:hypothetical protein